MHTFEKHFLSFYFAGSMELQKDLREGSKGVICVTREKGKIRPWRVKICQKLDRDA